jgi:hypothetical protein
MGQDSCKLMSNRQTELTGAHGVLGGWLQPAVGDDDAGWQQVRQWTATAAAACSGVLWHGGWLLGTSCCVEEDGGRPS